MIRVRAEETKNSVTYLVSGVTDSGEEVDIVLNVAAQCQRPGSRKAVADTLATARCWLEKGLGVPE